MLNFVETYDEFVSLLDKLNSGHSFFQLIYDERIHPSKAELIALFVHHKETNENYVLSFSHPDVVLLDNRCLTKLIDTKCKKYILNKKEANHFLNVDNFIDLSYDVYVTTLEQITYKYPRFSDIKSVPIMILKKSFEDTLKLLNSYIGNEDDNNTRLSNNLCKCFYDIETNGVYVNRDTFNLGELSLIDDNNYVYSQYNYYTPTTRPSNRFAKINFAALNKKKNERDSFVSRFGNEGGIVMIDYESYHLRLVGDYLNFELPPYSLHEYLGKFYHDKEHLNEEEYEISKKITFNLIYGGISDDIKKHIPFMKCVADYVDYMWSEFNNKGYVTTWKYNRKISKEYFTQLNPYKLFNYIIQSAETEQNCDMILKLNSRLETYRSKLFLYHYDAFMLDMHIDEFYLIKDIIKELTDNNKFPLRVYVGNSYGNLKELKV